MKKVTTIPLLPFAVRSNQYGFPCKTYYHIVDANGFVFHQDKKWRKKTLIEINKYVYRTEDSANISMIHLTDRYSI